MFQVKQEKLTLGNYNQWSTVFSVSSGDLHFLTGHSTIFVYYSGALLPVVVVVDSHVQRIVLAAEETTVTQQVSRRPIKCQSRLWSQRGTKVNGSHHGDNSLLRPTGIQITTKSYATLQAMAPTNMKMVHQTSLLHIESNLAIDSDCCRLPTTSVLSKKNKKLTLQPVLINKSKFLKATHCTKIRKLKYRRPWWWRS